MVRKGWSYKEDRRLSELAGSGKNLVQIAKAMDRTPNGIRNRSIRLGLSIKSQAATKEDQGLRLISAARRGPQSAMLCGIFSVIRREAND